VGCDRTRQGDPRAQDDSGQPPREDPWEMLGWLMTRCSQLGCSRRPISSAWSTGGCLFGIFPVAPILHGAWGRCLRSRLALHEGLHGELVLLGVCRVAQPGVPWRGAAGEHHGVGCDRTRQAEPRARGDSRQDPPSVTPQAALIQHHLL
jgi:hypothetical protein